ncbi:MAG TPA: hypothetical protein ENJ32_04930 [Crenotrichaceae bacterium]|nr:hypothetical protein [Crenotrichaceae bacterium]
MFVCVFVFALVFAGCASTSGNNGAVKVGPKPSSAFEKQPDEAILELPKLDVIIPVFNPGLSEDEENYEEEGIWPELRRAEANRFAYKLKQALDESGAFGAVRVTPDQTASGDLYVLGTIDQSDGEDVAFHLNVVDISGKQWLDRDFSHEVEASFYKNTRNTGQDAYDPVFEKAARKIVKALRKHHASELDNLKYLANLQFGASFNELAFSEYMQTDGGHVKLVSKPSDQDPLFQRVQAIRVQEQLFVDNLQNNYALFSQNMTDSYLAWQKASFIEKQLKSDAETTGILKIAGGVVLIALAIAAAAFDGGTALNIALGTAAAVGGIGGATMIASGYQSTEEAKFHQDALNEVGESINLEMSPQLISLENETVKLTGNAQEQFAQWREFLKRIYEQESTPDTKL